MYRTPKRSKLLVENDDVVNVTPPNRAIRPKALNTLDKGLVNGSPGRGPETSVLSPSETRRGRPRAELLNTLILEGSTSPSSIKCTFCSRVFPREKSLQAHLRTHTGEKPYACDYPRCTRRFAQSGQLKTHQRLHTGEKPFICASLNCERRFTHANRHCPEHPELTLKRFTSTPGSSIEKKFDEAHNAEVRQWLMNVDRRTKRSGSLENIETTPKKSRFKSEESFSTTGYFSGSSQNLTDDIENSPHSDNDVSTCSNASLESEIRDQSPRTTNNTLPCVELPKKRWLREAQNQQLWDSNQDLARPINWSEDIPNNLKTEEIEIVEEKYVPIEPQVVIENQKRPSVLVCAQGGKSKQITNDDMQGAMALVELKNGHTQCVNYNYRI